MKKIYICTPLDEKRFNLELITDTVLENHIFPFIPPVGQLQSKKKGALLDKKMIDHCDELWVFGSIGRDCSWEIGYAVGKGIPVTIFVTQGNAHIIEEEWMVPLTANIVDLRRKRGEIEEN